MIKLRMLGAVWYDLEMIDLGVENHVRHIWAIWDVNQTARITRWTGQCEGKAEQDSGGFRYFQLVTSFQEVHWLHAESTRESLERTLSLLILCGIRVEDEFPVWWGAECTIKKKHSNGERETERLLDFAAAQESDMFVQVSVGFPRKPYRAVVSVHVFNLVLQIEEAVRSGPAWRWLYGHIQVVTHLLTFNYCGTVRFDCKVKKKKKKK